MVVRVGISMGDRFEVIAKNAGLKNVIGMKNRGPPNVTLTRPCVLLTYYMKRISAWRENGGAFIR